MKKNVWKCLLVSLLVVMGLPSISTATDPQFSSIYGKLPLFFVENKGQADTSLQFYSYGGQMYFSQEGIYTHFIQRDSTFQNRFRNRFHEKDSLSLDTAPLHEKHLVLKKRFLNTHTQCEIVGEDELPGKLNYFIGNDSTQWHTNLRTFKQIRYKNLYPGIDLVYHGNQGPTEYDLVINPEAHNLASAPLSQIQFTIEGADKVELSPDGDLLVHTPLGILKEKSPVSYQMKNGIKQSLSSHFTLISDNTFSFDVPQYDKNLSLVIDPLIYSTFLGGSDRDITYDIDVNESGCAYIIGYSYSLDFPVTIGTYDTTFNGYYDVFVTKLDTLGSNLIYSTYWGGLTGGTYAYDLFVDKSGVSYVTGYTESSTIPITSEAYDKTYNGNGDCFVMKLDSLGSNLLYSSFLGGSNFDSAAALAVDESGRIYITGHTLSSTDFPITPGSFEHNYKGDYDCFVTRFNSSGTSLEYSTFIGGAGQDNSCGISIDKTDCAYIAGNTWSTDFPISAGAFDNTNAKSDGFITKLNSSGTGLIYSTYLGGSGVDYITGIVVDEHEYVYLTGQTYSDDFPTSVLSYDTSYNGGEYDCFVSKLNSIGSDLIFSTYLGGSGCDGGNRIVVDKNENCYITGWTNSTNFPTTISALYRANNGFNDGFITELNDLGSVIKYSTYIGSNTYDLPRSIILDGSRNVYITGYTLGVFPTTRDSFDNTFNGNIDGFVVKLALNIPDLPYIPNLKMLSHESVSHIFDLEDYNEGYPGENYSIMTNFLDLENLSVSTVSQGAYSNATAGVNTYGVSNTYGACTASNKVKYSSYRMNKLPWVGLRTSEKTQLNLSSYCYSTAGVVIPPSFGSVSALVVNDTTLLKAKWIDSNSIEITALSGFTTSGWIDVIASPVTSHFGMDLDRERIYVYPNLLSIGEFTCYEDMENYGTEKTTDKTSYPVVSFLTAAQDGSGVSQSNVMSFDFTSADQGIKMTPQFSRMLDYEDNHWYIARMKVSSPTEDNDLQAQLYHYNGVIPDASHIDLSANIYFGTPTTWSWIETPLYTNATGTGYPQIMLKAGTKTGKIYLAEVQVIKAVPTLFDSTPRSKHTLGYAYSDFSSLSQLSMGWSTTECFDNGTSKPSLSVMVPGFLTVSFSGGESIKFTAWNGNTQEIYTPSSTPGSEIGMKADIFIQSGSFDTYDAMILLGCYGVAAHGSYDFSSIGGQLAAMAEFGQITEGTHYLAAPGRNAYHQMQFVLKNNENGVLAVQNVDFLRDTDNPYFGDINLFP